MTLSIPADALSFLWEIVTAKKRYADGNAFYKHNMPEYVRVLNEAYEAIRDAMRADNVQAKQWGKATPDGVPDPRHPMTLEQVFLLEEAVASVALDKDETIAIGEPVPPKKRVVKRASPAAKTAAPRVKGRGRSR